MQALHTLLPLAIAVVLSSTPALAGVTCRTDSYGTTRDNHGNSWRTDSYGTTHGSDGTTCRTDSYGTTRCKP